MQLLYVTDLHGDPDKYDRLEMLARELRPDAVVNGGDLFPPGLAAQKRFIRGRFRAHLATLASEGIPYLFVPGNDDAACWDALLRDIVSAHPGAHNIARTRVVVGDYEFIGLDLVPDTPFRLKDRCRQDEAGCVSPFQYGTPVRSTPEGFEAVPPGHLASLPSIAQELRALPRPGVPARAVYVIHTPPAGLGLDLTFDLRQVGSWALRGFLQERQPLLSLHGHIHESPRVYRVWRRWLGRTLCIQPGQEPGGAGLCYVWIDLAVPRAERRTEP